MTAIWINGNKRTGIMECDNMYLVINSVWDGYQQQTTSTKKCKTLKAAEREVAKVIKAAKEMGTPGEFVKQ